MAKTVTVTDSTTELLTIDNFGTFAFWVTNSGATDLDSFAIQGRNSPDAVWIDILSTTSDFATASNFLIMTDDSVDPTALAADEEFNFALTNITFFELRLIATVASGTTTIDVKATSVGDDR